MKIPLSHLAVAVLFAVTAAAPAAAQNPPAGLPTAAQAQQMLQNPDLVAQLRDRLLASGLTPDQVRARLAAEGYPPNMLDAYLPGGTAGARDSLPSDDVFNAMTALGVSDSADVETLRGAGQDYQRSLRARRDSLTGRNIVIDPRTGLPREMVPDTAKKLPASEQIFGLNVFRSATSEFQPNLSGPVDANYRVGPGDQLVLILTGDVEKTQMLDVTREGFVLIPQVGQIQVANLTLAELETVLYTRLSRVYSGVKKDVGTTRFSVTPSKLRSNQIFVNGDVMRPGSYRISGAGTALTALYAAGGPTDIGSLRTISVRRGGKTVSTLDVYNYLLHGDAGGDVRLENGDVVFVPVHGARVRVAGQVNRPATYELKETETLADVIRDAGGLSANAGLQRLQIERIIPPPQRSSAGRDRVLLEVTSDQLAGGNVPALRIEPGDIVRVEPVDARVRSKIAVNGNVWLPGTQGFTPGMTLSQALRGAGGAKPDSYLGEVLVTRLNADSSRSQLRAALRDTTGAILGTDLPLRDDDEIRVFSRTDFRPERYVAISGAVRRPGQYPYREGITVRDLVLLAGGLDESADLRAAEIARIPANRADGVTATTFRVPLDSTYLGDRGPDGKYYGPPGLPAAAGNTPEIVLDAYDNVLILPQPDWHLLRSVVITGEVRSPGRYTIQNKADRISDLVKRAGGLSPSANADGAFYTRQHAAVSYRSRRDSVRTSLANARLAGAAGGNVPGATGGAQTNTTFPNGPLPTRFANDTALRVGIDLKDVLRDARSADNLLLEDGDSLDVPPMHNTVEIQGAVNAPTVVAIAPGEKLEHYIRAAGGPNRRLADAGGAYVVQPNGKIESRHRVALVFRSDPTPRAGATVIVPVKDTTSNTVQTLQTISIVTGIVATVLTALAVIKR
jgi:polysaccharide export outer membrane protein